MTIALRDVDDSHDWEIFKGWLNQPHVLTTWGEPAAIIAELQRHPRQDMRVIALSDRPIGLVCWQVPSAQELMDAGLADLPKGLVDVDIMLGQVNVLGLSYGTSALSLVADQLKAQVVLWIGLTTQKANQGAIRSFIEVGCSAYREFTEDGTDYIYFTRSLNSH
jgi:hypothetical protein